ncbi:hypothetical protein BGM09_07510 [Streptomyces sp. CBMA29]|nr:hypothetical protein [Streptomyces sp. CBMA29]
MLVDVRVVDALLPASVRARMALPGADWSPRGRGQEVGRWWDLRVVRKAVQAVGVKVRVGPWGSLESRTGTALGQLVATSTQSPPLELL